MRVSFRSVYWRVIYGGGSSCSKRVSSCSEHLDKGRDADTKAIIRRAWRAVRPHGTARRGRLFLVGYWRSPELYFRPEASGVSRGWDGVPGRGTKKSYPITPRWPVGFLSDLEFANLGPDAVRSFLAIGT